MTSRGGAGGYENWGELRDHLIDAFNETPHPATEHDIITAYQLHPTAVERAASETVVAVKTGTARSGWGVLRSRAAKITTPVSNPTRSSSVDREKQIGRAEQWIRTAGLHFDSATEITLELFDNGLLSSYAQAELVRLEDRTWTIKTAGDTALIQRMTTVWQQHRPTGQQLEHEATERAERWKEQHASTSRNSVETPSRTRSTEPRSSTGSASSQTSSSPSSTSPKPPASASKQTPTSGIPPTRSRTTSAPPSPASANDDLPL